MNMTTKADELAKRIQEAEDGFQNATCKGKWYSEEEMRIKNEWRKKIERATKEWVKFLNEKRIEFLSPCRRVSYPCNLNKTYIISKFLPT